MTEVINEGQLAATSGGADLISMDEIGGAVNIVFGGGRGTHFPDAGLYSNYSIPKWITRSTWHREIGDGVDDAHSAALGTREAPTALTGLYLLSSRYGAPFDGQGFIALSQNSHYPSSTAYLRRIAEANMWSAATPTQTQGWGAWEFTTANGTQTPFSRHVMKPDGKRINYANAFEMSGIAYPFAPGSIAESRMPIANLAWPNYTPDASNTDIAGDMAVNANYKVRAVRSLAAPLTEGYSEGLNRADQEAVHYRRWGTTQDSKYMAVVLSTGTIALAYPNATTPGRETLRLVPRASATSSFTMVAGDAVNPTRVEVTSSLADADLNINAKGAGVVRLRGGSATIGAGVVIGAASGGDKGFGTLNVDGDVYRDGLKVLGSRLGPIADATPETVVPTINAILAAMRAHGSIS